MFKNADAIWYKIEEFSNLIINVVKYNMYRSFSKDSQKKIQT